jgi:plasmanylethanolamine desaturase
MAPRAVAKRIAQSTSTGKGETGTAPETRSGGINRAPHFSHSDTALRINMSIFLQGVTTILAADFVSGFVHWAEDAYARHDTPVIGKLIANANIEHHKKPRAFIERNWIESSWDLLAVGVLVIAGAWSMHLLTWHVWLFVLIAINANQIHKWAHRNPRENGMLVTLLQKIRVLQTQRHHARHHTGQKDSHYCSVTNVLNPVLDQLRVWKALERVNEMVFGLKRRPDPTVKLAPEGGHRAAH